MLKQIAATKFSCDYCFDHRQMYFPQLHQFYYLASICVPQRLPIGAFNLFSDLDASLKKFCTEFDIFQRFP